jgi:beta-N-acetylhexosaminidase
LRNPLVYARGASDWPPWIWLSACAALVLSAAGGIWLGWHIRNPALAEVRPWPLIGALVLGVAFVMAAIALPRRQPTSNNPSRLIAGATLAMAYAAFVMPLLVELGFQWDRLTVQRADPERIAALGQHVIVGFNTDAEITALVERRAAGGIFIRRHNVTGLSATQISAKIDALQAIRRRQGLAPLWVATDQEGGPVARLSPPLPAQPALREAIGDEDAPEVRQARVTDYARLQARGLASLGVNLNFAPVVDLDWGVVNPNDRHTKINRRVIAKEPGVVGETAASYCAALRDQGVACTLKHFPGIGRVFEDTHRQAAALNFPLTELEATDFAPFRRVLGDTNSAAVLMLSHVTVPALDKDHPASRSAAVVQTYVRGNWGFDGVVVTDDMCMGAIYESWAGIGSSSVGSLNAGVDLVLIAWDSAQFYPIMAALLRAQDRGQLSDNALAASKRRLSHALKALQAKRPGDAK